MFIADNTIYKDEFAINFYDPVYCLYILKLTQKSKANQFNKYFHDNKLNIFKTLEGNREVINISKVGLNNINCIQIGKSTITNSSDIANEFNRHSTSVVK